MAMNEQVLFQDARRYLAVLHKRRAILITSLAVCLLLAVLYNYTTRPIYQATAQILIDRDTPNVLTSKEVVDLVPSGADYLQTQYQLLRGRKLAEAVIEKLKLRESPEFLTQPLMTPWERIQRRFLGQAPTAAVDADGMKLSPAVAAFRSRITVEPVAGSRLVNLRFLAYEPTLAAEAVNALADFYIKQSMEFRFTQSEQATDWLGEHALKQKARLEEAERRLQAYRESEGLLNFEERQSLIDQKLSTLSSAALNARTERIQKESLLGQMRGLGDKQLESNPLVLANPLINGLKADLAGLQRDLAKLSESFGDKHPDVIRVRNDIHTTEEKLRNEIRNVGRGLESEYRAAAAQEASLNANLEAAKREALEFNRKAIEFGVLKREVETNQQVYKELLTRNKQTNLEKELETTNIRIVEKAERPRGPYSPRHMRNYQLALLIGLLLGIGLTVLFEHFDNTLKTPEDVKEHFGLPFLGMVPDVGVKTANAAARPSPLILKNPQSAVAEAYRVLRTNLIFSSAETSGRALVVTSANPGEGKTTTVANLASSLALNGAKVLAVDADLRRPTMHQHFGIPKTPGLSDLIVGKCQASEAIQTTRFKGLQVLPCGYVPPNPAELLGSAAMKQVVDALRSHYDWVLIDTPPILAMADTPVLCPLVEGVILVIGAERSGRPAIQRAVDQIVSVGGKVVGVVLNKVDLESNSYYYGQYYGEYYRSYYAEGASRQKQAAETARSGPRPVRRS
jgi:capsular exopolysaccharide synthesis family protein